MDRIQLIPRTVLGENKTFIQKGITAMLFAPKEKGQGLVEYAIILALVAIVVIAVMQLLGPKIGNTFSTINSSLP
jgi:pilus assembly protein Flp/PilA